MSLTSGLRRPLILVTGLMFLLSLWQLLAQTHTISSLLFPPPTDTAVRLGQLLASGEMPEALLATLSRLFRGLAIGVPLGGGIGLALGISPTARHLADPVVGALHPIPKVSLLPLALVMFGFGDAAHIAIIALSTAFPILVNVMVGASAMDPLHAQVAHHYGLRGWQRVRRVTLPGSLPFALAGLRIAVNTGFVITIAMELVFANAGIGGIMWRSWEQLRLTDLFAALVVVALSGMAFTALINLAARRLTPWETS